MPTILITGANRGIGLEFVKQFASENYHVIACSRNPKLATELNNIASQYNNIDVHQLDITNQASIKALKEQLGNTAIDIFINNAGIYLGHHNGFNDLSVADWKTIFDVNCIAPIKLVEYFYSNILNSQLKKIIFISSKMGSVTDNQSGGSYLYRSSKAALNAAVKSLSIDLKQDGICVLSLHPGWVKTDMGGPNALISTTESIKGMKKVIENTALKQSGGFFAFDGKEVPW